MNKFKIKLSSSDQNVNIPLKMEFDYYGQDNDIDIFQNKTEEEIVGKPIDFESKRFAHSAYTNTIAGPLITEINYNFFFFDYTVNVSAALTTNWVTSFRFTNASRPNQFSDRNLYYFEKPFTKSFFKLDFYDSPNDTNQTIYLTVIIPVQQGKKSPVSNNTVSNYITSMDLTEPKFTLDCVGQNKEGFYIYWINNTRFVNVTNFYMSAKFFNGNDGKFYRLINQDQGSMSSLYSFDPEKYFYQKVELNYKNGVYSVFDIRTNNRIGSVTNPINWYEYVSPK